MVDTQGVDLKRPQRGSAIARRRLLRCWLRRLGLLSRGTEQEFKRAQVVFILDLAHVVGLQEAGRIEGILQNDRSRQAEEEEAAISSSPEDQDD